MTEKILLAQISCSERIRQDLGDIDDLKQSLLEHGLLQPIGVRPNPSLQGSFQVIWGGRRFEAAKQLGWEEIECSIISCEEDYELREKELEENIRRKDMTWQEQALSLQEIHKLKKARHALIGEKWGYRETGKLLGVALGNVSYAITAAELIKKGDEEIKKAPSLPEALRIIIRRKEAELLAHKGQAAPPPKVEEVGFSQEELDLMAPEVPAANRPANTVVRLTLFNSEDQSKLPHKAQLIIADNISGLPVRGLESMSLVKIFPEHPVNLPTIDAWVAVKEESVSQTPLAFTPSLNLLAFLAGTNPPAKAGMPPFYSCNAAVDKVLFGVRATPMAVIKQILPGMVRQMTEDENSFPHPSIVEIHSLSAPEYAVTAMMLGYEVWLRDDANTEVIVRVLANNGVTCELENHSQR